MKGVDLLVSLSEKVRIALFKRKTTITELAEKMGTSPQNLSNKFRRESLNEKEIVQITDLLDCEIHLIMKDTGEKI